MNTNPVIHKPMAHWLFAVAGLVFAMVIIGAITRLTESGLSMVEWRPLIGAIPPLSEEEWQRVFDLYRQTPEYRLEHSWMGLQDFKTIFFWEWFHRLMGRIVGLAYGLPLLWFWLRGQIPAGYGWKLFGLLILGGAQGVMGWYMVESGLVDVPSVSHYRLAAHLGLAFLIFALLVWIGLDLYRHSDSYTPDKGLYTHGWAVLGLMTVTIFWGAYVAGLDAGLIYGDTFPKMGNQWIPGDMWFYEPAWINFFENHSGVQFTHRWLGMALVIAVLSLWGHAMAKGKAGTTAHLLVLMVFLQMGLGIATLMTGVAIPVAVAHQGGAVVLTLLLITFLHRVRSKV